MSEDSRTTRRVYISYATPDKSIATQIAQILRAQGLDVWYDQWALNMGDSLAARVRQEVISRDVLIILISRHSVESQWMRAELETFLPRQLHDRAVRVVPAIIDDCLIPTELAPWSFVDLRHDFEGGVQQLGQRLRVLPRVRFRDLEPPQFEMMIADLLTAMGFSVQLTAGGLDSPIDMIGSIRTRDVFGTEQNETWLIQVKHYREQRISVSVLQQMLGYMLTASRPARGLIVTSAQLTSVARDFLATTTSRTGYQLRVIDRTELTSLLINYPAVVEKYFGLEQAG